MKLEIVAEGVESAADAAMLRELRYDYAQGFWYSPPLPADAFERWLARFSSTSGYSIRRDRAGAI